MSKPQRIIDLTINLHEGINGVKISPAKNLEKDGWNTSYYEIYSHVGTHMDAPRHFGNNSPSIDEIEVGRFITPAWIIDATDLGPKDLITLRHLGALIAEFKAGESLIIKTGWSSKFGLPEYVDDMPRISKEFAEWCVNNKVNIIAVEQPSVADVHHLEEVTDIHKTLMDGHVLIVEGLTNLDKIKAPKVTMIAMPLKIKAGDGAPTRVVAIV